MCTYYKGSSILMYVQHMFPFPLPVPILLRTYYTVPFSRRNNHVAKCSIFSPHKGWSRKRGRGERKGRTEDLTSLPSSSYSIVHVCLPHSLPLPLSHFYKGKLEGVFVGQLKLSDPEPLSSRSKIKFFFRVCVCERVRLRRRRSRSD